MMLPTLTSRILLLFVTLLVPATAVAQRSGSDITSDLIFESIGAREGATICEIGAGDGSLSIAAGRLVGPRGRVYTSELGDTRVRALQQKIEASGLSHVTVVTGDTQGTKFPDATCDAMVLRDVYHHLTDPVAMNASMLAALKPGGRVAIVDFTPPGEEASCPADRAKDGMHGVKPDTVSQEMKNAGFEQVNADRPPQRWFLLVFRRSG